MALVEVVSLVSDNGEGGILVVMKRTEPDVLSTLGLQHDMLSNECGEISLIAHPIDIRLVKKHVVSTVLSGARGTSPSDLTVFESSLKSLPHEGGLRLPAINPGHLVVWS